MLAAYVFPTGVGVIEGVCRTIATKSSDRGSKFGWEVARRREESLTDVQEKWLEFFLCIRWQSVPETLVFCCSYVALTPLSVYIGQGVFSSFGSGVSLQQNGTMS